MLIVACLFSGRVGKKMLHTAQDNENWTKLLRVLHSFVVQMFKLQPLVLIPTPTEAKLMQPAHYYWYTTTYIQVF